MNGYAPLIALDPGADGVPYASMLHKDIFVERRVPQSLATPFSTISAVTMRRHSRQLNPCVIHTRTIHHLSLPRKHVLKRHNESLSSTS
jgi:hypothetical protein